MNPKILSRFWLRLLLSLFAIACSGLNASPVIQIEAPAGVVLSPTSGAISFPHTLIGDSTPKTFIIRNKGDSSLLLTTAVMGGVNSADFEIVANSAATLSSGDDSYLRISFKPSALGARSATLSFASNDSTSGQISIILTGTGTQKSGVKRFVKKSSAGTGDGSSWQNAYGSLQAAIAAAQAGDEIWVASGTYKPSATNDRNATFLLKEGVMVYGGFVGSEASLAERHVSQHLTILSGDLLGNDNANVIDSEVTRSDNSAHVVTSVTSLLLPTRLDGVVVECGNAKAPDYYGGGIYLGFGNVDASNLTLCNCVIRNNSCRFDGGGIFNSGHVRILDCVFERNRASNAGSAIHNYDRTAPQIINTVFYGNLGGTIVYSGDTYSRPEVINCTIVGNEGAIVNAAYASPQFRNCVIWGNSASPALLFDTPTLNTGSPGILKNNLIQGGWPGSNIDSNPQFEDASNPKGADGIWGTTDDGLRIKATSPGLNIGDNSAIAGFSTTDLQGLQRVLGFVDLGAYETAVDTDSDGLDDSVESNTGIYVSAANTGTNPSVADTDGDGVPDGLEVKEKTSPVDASKFNSFSQGLFVYYPFDGNLQDLSGNARHVVASGRAFAEGARGDAGSSLNFPYNTAIAIPGSGSWNGPSFSVSVWSKLADNAQLQDRWPQISGKRAGFYDNVYSMGLTTSNAAASSSGWIGGSYSGSTDFSVTTAATNTLGVWVHLCLVYDGSQVSIYKDGIKQETKTLPFSLPASSNPVTIGGNGWVGPEQTWQGLVDNFRYYGRALTPAETLALYQSEAPPSPVSMLSGIDLSAGVLSPGFASGTTFYTASVSNVTASMTVTPTVTDSTATVTVNGSSVASGAASQSIPLNVGLNPITVLVTAQDGTTMSTYTVNVTRAPSAVSTLTDLQLSSGILSPTFAPDSLAYTTSVSNLMTSIQVTAIVTDVTASVKVDGATVASGEASASISLVVGDNTIPVEVTAQDGTTRSIYTINVSRAPSAVCSLSGLTTNHGSLSPGFDSATTSYDISVLNAITSINVTPTVTDVTSTVKVDGVAVASGDASSMIPLTVGSNSITVLVTAEDGTTTSTYTVNVTRISNVATLSELALSTGTLSPAFASATETYTASVPNATASMTVTPTVTDSTATMTVSGVSVASGAPSQSIPLAVGTNPITVSVTAQNGTTTSTYTVNVTRAPSSVSTLSSIALSSGTLGSVFASNTLAYTTSVSNLTTLIHVRAMATDVTASVKVNGTTIASGDASAAIPLVVGDNAIPVVVTAQDGLTTKTYMVTVKRAPSSIAILSRLDLSSGSLSPVFASNITSYTASVAHAITSIKVMPTLTDLTAKVKVNGVLVSSGSLSAPTPLVVGNNTITTQVTAQDGTSVKTYRVTVNRAPSSVATLSELSLSAGYLNQGFSPTVITYTASVANTVTSINVKPTLTDPTAKVKVNGVLVTSGSLSAPIPLAVGNNILTTQVTAQNGTSVTTYTIEVTRRESRDATLSALIVKTAALSPKFKPTTTGYTASVPVATKSVMIKAAATHGAAKIKINGAPVKSGTLSAAIPLKLEKNVIKVVVTSQYGSTKTYKITIFRTRSLSASVASKALANAENSPPRESMVSNVVYDGKKYLQLTIRRNLGAPKPVVEVSPNLVAWFSGDKHTTVLVDDGRILTVRDNTPTKLGAKRFIRTSVR